MSYCEATRSSRVCVRVCVCVYVCVRVQVSEGFNAGCVHLHSQPCVLHQCVCMSQHGTDELPLRIKPFSILGNYLYIFV